MSDAGIAYLNLHQLRLTPHNLSNMLNRNYTYLHGEHLTVLESELTALKLMRHAAANRIALPINYCSYVYKNRFQRAAARRRSSRSIASAYEDITENGYIRSLYVKGPADVLGTLAESLKMKGCPADCWSMTKDKDRIFFGAAVWQALTFEGLRPGVFYSDARLVPSVTYRNQFKEIELNRNRSIFVERVRASEDIEIVDRDRDFLERVIFGEKELIPAAGGTPALDRILQYERISPDLQDYNSGDSHRN
jgi:hypothetical protein